MLPTRIAIVRPAVALVLTVGVVACLAIHAHAADDPAHILTEIADILTALARILTAIVQIILAIGAIGRTCTAPAQKAA